MTRDEQIEKAFKAHEDAPSWQGDPVARDAAIRWHLRGFNDALAVFEEGHAPTDDERDGLAKAMCAIEARSKAATLEEVQSGIQRWTRHCYEADRLIEELSDYGLMLRRSEDPEPSAEIEKLNQRIEKLDAALDRELGQVERLHDIADRLSWAIAPMEVIGEHSSGNDPWENAIEYAANRVWAEPQGEPSDAQVETAWRTYESIPPETFVMGPSVGKARERMRAALRAARGAGGER